MHLSIAKKEKKSRPNKLGIKLEKKRNDWWEHLNSKVLEGVWKTLRLSMPTCYLSLIRSSS